MRVKDGVRRYGEQEAVHLAAAGGMVLERTWWCGLGEVGIVAPDVDRLGSAQVEHVRGVA